MKTRNFKTCAFFFFLLCAGLIFLSCNSTELAEPRDQEVFYKSDLQSESVTKLHYMPDRTVLVSNEKYEMEGENLLDKPVKEFSIYHLIEFNVRTMTKLVDELPLKEEDPEFIHEDMIGKETCLLIGEGQGWSEEMGRSLVRAKIEFYPLTMEMKGELTCEFYPSGDILRITLVGHGPMQKVYAFDGPHEALVLDAKIEHESGTHLRTEEEGTCFLLNAKVLTDPCLENFSTYFITQGKMYE